MAGLVSAPQSESDFGPRESIGSLIGEAFGRFTGRPVAVMGRGEWVTGNAGQGFLEALLGASPMVILTEMSDGAGLSHHGPYQSGTGDYGTWDVRRALGGVTKRVMVSYTRAEMAQHVVRFKDMTQRPRSGAGYLPDEVANFLTCDANYTYMAPKTEGQSHIQKCAALVGGDAGDAISVSMAVCSPGRGPTLHAHLSTVEAFFCLSGRFAIVWGDKGENSVTIEEWDFIRVSKGVVRSFRNVGDDRGALLVIVQGQRNSFNDVVRAPYVIEQMRERFGDDASAKVEAMGGSITAPVKSADEASAEPRGQTVWWPEGRSTARWL